MTAHHNRNTAAEQNLIEARLRARLEASSQSDLLPTTEPAPLSDAQERLWILHKLEPESPVAHRPLAFRLHGVLDEDVLARCLTEISRRHAILRTVYEEQGGQPRQRALKPEPVELRTMDLTHLPIAEGLSEAHRLAARVARRPFDLEAGPMHPPHLLRLGAEDHVLVLALHHIAFDGWSAKIFQDELSMLYAAFERGARAALPALPMQYAGYARWQRRRQRAESDAVVYWKRQLGGLPAELALPTDRRRPQHRLIEGARQSFQLSAETTRALKALSLEEDATLFMTLLAGFQVLLGRYAHQQDLAVGVPVAGRTLTHTESLIGCFINTLVLRADLSSNPTFRAMVVETRRCVLEALSHQSLSFARVVEMMKPERHVGRAPLVQVLFQLRNQPRATTDATGSLRFNVFTFDSGLADGLDLTLDLTEVTEGLKGTVRYSTDLFDAETITRMIGHYRVLLEGIAADPDRRLSQLPILTEPERRQLLIEWNDTAKAHLDVCLHTLFEQQADKQPGAVALVFEGQEMTYGALEARANQLAHHLIAQGVGPERRVVLNLERSPEVIIAILGILKAGGACVPLDPDTPAKRLHFMLKDIEATALITDSALLAGLPEHSTPTLVLEEEADRISERPASRPATGVSLANLAYVFYTSGTTGRPKGVMIEHRAVVNNIQWLKYTFPLDSTDAVLFHTALTFDVSFSELFGGLACGARVVIAHPDEEKDPGALTRLMLQQEVTRIHAGPSMLQMLVLQPEFGRCLLRSIITGAEVVPASLVRQIKELRDVEVINGYGPTETTIEVSVWPCEQEHARRALPIGRPIDNTQVYVVDEHLNPVPIGVPGELLIGGVQLARGYLNRPELTAERFIPDPFSTRPGARLYRSGDLVRWLPEGLLDFIGRIDNQIKLRGYRIELGEIEAVLGAHPAVRLCAVTVWEAQPGDQRLVAYLVPNTDSQPERGDLQAYLRQHLMEYMVPSAFVWLSELPLTVTGKVNRRVLPKPTLSVAQRNFVAPRTPLEKQIADVWAEVLGLDHISIYDDFFDLGGHSLLAIRISAKLSTLLNVEVPMPSIFTSSTVASLGVEITGKQVASMQPRMRAQRGVLSSSQQRFWLLHQLDQRASTSTQVTTCRLHGQLDVAALQKAFHHIFQRHEVLRSVIRLQEDKLVQVVQPISDVSTEIPLIDLSGLSEQARSEEIERHRHLARNTTFDLGQDPLLHATLLRLGAEEHTLLLVGHHIISDAWTRQILFRELQTGYAAFSKGEVPALPALPIQYADYAAREQERLQTPPLQRQLEYWKEHLAGVEPVALPTDRPRPPVQTYQGAWQTLSLTSTQRAQLEALAQQERVTLFVLLLAVFKVLLSRHAGQQDLVVGTPVAGRGNKETQDLIGCFLNSLALRTDLSGATTFRGALHRVRDTVLGGLSNQEVPFEVVVDAVQPARDLSRAPLFQVFFNMHTFGDEGLHLPGLDVEMLPPERINALFDITLYVFERADVLDLRLLYNADLFDAGRMADMLQQYATLLDQIVAEPNAPILAYSLLTPEAQSLLPDPRLALDEPYYASVVERITLYASQRPHAEAIEWGTDTLSYAVLSERMDRLARRLKAVGVEPEKVVAITGPRSPRFVISILAVWACGGIVLPLDPNLPERRRQQMLDEANASFIVQISPGAAAGPGTLHVRATTGEPVQPVTDLDTGSLPEVPPNAPAYIFFTSGTTGVPKAILGDHKGVAHFLAWQREQFSVGPGDRCAGLTALSFDVLLRDLFLPLTSGATLCLLPDERDPVDTCTWLADEAITVTHLVPSLVKTWLAENPSVALPALRLSFFAGEPLTGTLVQQWRKGLSLEARIINLYGATETTLAKCFYEVPPGPLPHRLPVGVALPNTQALVLNNEGTLCGIGEPGEIVIRTPFRTRGYINQPEAHRRAFITSLFTNDPEDVLYRTGDLGRYEPDGTLFVLGRIDHQVKVRGVRIEPEEVAAVLGQHPNVAACAVVTRPDTEGEVSLLACVIPESGEGGAMALRSYVAERLGASFVPASFVFLDALPLMHNGKVDRRALKVLKGEDGLRAAPFEAPQPGIEEQIATIWAEVLNASGISRHDDFFDLGGHSLRMIQAMVRLRSQLDIKVPLNIMFKASTVAKLASEISQRMVLNSQEDRAGEKTASRSPVSHATASLSDAQERLWIQYKLEPENLVGNRSLSFRLRGALDERILAQSLTEIVRRHAILRTIYEEEAACPVQRVLPPAPVELAVQDLSALPEAERLPTAQQIAAEAAQRPFELEKSPMHPPQLLRLGEHEHVLVLALHHIAFDGWSVEILLEELGVIYEAFVQGNASPLPRLSMQYVDYARRQRQRRIEGSDDDELDYWTRQLEGLPPVLALPTDRPRPQHHLVHGAKHSFVLPTSLTSALKQLSREEHVTLFMTLLAAFQVLLGRYARQEDFAVGVPVAGRTSAETERLVGCFINMLVVRADLAGDPLFRELLRDTLKTMLEALSHQEMSFARVVEALQPERHMSSAPLFQVAFQLRNNPRASAEQRDGPHVEFLSFDTKLADGLDLQVALTETEEGLEGTIIYSTDLFDAETIDRIIAHYRTLLEAVVADPDRRLSALPLLTEPERQQMLVAWNDTTEAFPDVCLHTLFEQQADAQPEAVALVFEHKEITYGELEARSNRLAQVLREQGVGPGVLVGLCVERTIEMVTALLAILKAGGAYLPLDPALPEARLLFMLADARPALILTQHGLAPLWPEGLVSLHFMEETSDAGPAVPRVTSEVRPADLAYILYTSGSTGRPKGVLVPHRGLANVAVAQQQIIDPRPGDRILQFASLTFDASIFEIMLALLNGATLCLGTTTSLRPGPPLMRFLHEHAISIGLFPPSVLAVLPAHEVPSSLRVVLSAGEACSADVGAQWSKNCSFYNLYGLTEATIWSTSTPVASSNAASSIGRPIINTQLYVLLPHLVPAPIGVPGELYIGGVGVARGYLNRPELTAERFIPDPFSTQPGARLYRTGDLVRWLPEGILDFIGRVDTQVKLRGYRIELGEIEAVLSAHPAVRLCAVTVWEAQPGDQRLVAYLVSDTDSQPERGDLQAYLREHLMEYMVPAAFVWLPEMPLSASGKINRRALPEPDLTVEKAAFVAPETPIEEQIAMIWEEVLGTSPISRHDDFFDLGGHSLLVIQAMARLRDQLHIEVPLSTLFTTSTVAALANAISLQLTHGVEEEDLRVLLDEVEMLSDDEAQKRLGNSDKKGA